MLHKLRRRLGSWLGGRPTGLSSADACHGRRAAVGGAVAECHAAWPEDGAFERQWRALWSRCPRASTFNHPIWQRCAVGAALPEGALRLITVRREVDGELLAVLSMEHRPSGFVESAGPAASDHLDPLVDPAHEAPAWRAAARLFRDLWDAPLRGITFHNVSDAWAGEADLAAACREAALAAEVSAAGASARLDLPADWDAYLASLDAHERKELRRKLRKAQEQGGARLEVVTRPDAAALARALDLIEAADESKRLWLRANVRPLLERAGPALLEAGRMRLLLLHVQDRPAAALIDLPSSQGPMLYNSGFDPAARPWSPGVVLFATCIRDAIERGCGRIDFLRGGHAYKYRLGAADAPLRRVSIGRAAGAGRRTPDNGPLALPLP